MATAQLDKTLDTPLTDGQGTISIRVVVLAKADAPGAAPSADEAPKDADPDEVLPDKDKRPNSTFMEEPKRGKQCCVFLINGQRQHAWDNTFIVRDLDLKYLRNRMIIVIDCDGLKPRAISELMRGHRLQFYEGDVFGAIEQRVIATLKGDPDLRRLEEEAEDEISSLEAGDESVKAALDQLIDQHHDSGTRTKQGVMQAGGETQLQSGSGPITKSQPVVIEGDQALGVAATDPVLQIRPDITTLRLKPNDARAWTILPRPEGAWKELETLAITFDPPVKEMLVTRTSQLIGEELTLKFVEPEGFDDDEYPIETTMRATAVFKGFDEPRVLERRVVINPGKTPPPPQPPKPLKDEPAFVRVTSRQPIKIVAGGPDVHVKLKWDGKDDLVLGKPATWAIKATCEAPGAEPNFFLTNPDNGRFEMLIQANQGLAVGEELKFDIEAIGPGTTLFAAFLATVVEVPTPRKIDLKMQAGGQRRPPYELKYVKRPDWEGDTCWGESWTGQDAGSFDEPSPKSPLVIYVNQDMDLLVEYRDKLTAKKLAETTIQQRINKYTTHIAFHLYQMYLKKRQMAAEPGDEVFDDEQMRDEIQRVSRTLIELMEVSQ
jgi:hypothetical protein